MQILRFNCPGCSEQMQYTQIFSHVEQCELAKKQHADGGSAPKINHQQVLMNRRITQAEKFAGKDLYSEQFTIPDEVFIFQKDSKMVSIINLPQKNVNHKYVDFKSNFPHNFQMIQIGNQPRVFMIGGGDFKSMPDTMFQCHELLKIPYSQDMQRFSLKFSERKKMKYPRHGHSLCAIANKYILVTGSRKEVNNSQLRVEIYDIDMDDWLELSSLNMGRHYHSSTNFNNQFVYVFGGILNQTKKYTNTVERLKFSRTDFNSPWERMQIDQPHLYLNPTDIISARQGAGMCQLSPNELLIVGGFSGRFSSDYYIMDMNKSTGNVEKVRKYERSPQGTTMFPFQVPTLGDTVKREVLSVDWQHMTMHRLQGTTFQLLLHAKPQ